MIDQTAIIIALAMTVVVMAIFVWRANKVEDEIGPITTKPYAPPPAPPEPEEPQGPRFEWDPKDNCWVLKDCVRVDHGLMWHNFEPFHAYANINLKWKNEGDGKPTTEKQTDNDKKP